MTVVLSINCSHVMVTCFLLAVVTVKHKQLAYDVREDVGSVRVCAVLTGQTENNVGVLFTTMDGNGAAGKFQKE